VSRDKDKAESLACYEGNSSVKSLPRLCYIGEVPIECSYHGSALLWRLFESYPHRKLLIVEGIHRSSIERRLPGVRYLHPFILNRPFWPGRYARQASEVLYKTVPILAVTLAPRVAYERPEAIITVCHGLYWLVAAKVSNLLNLPLHLILHDHVPTTLPASERLKSRILCDFGRIYSTATSRFCVSDTMAAEYEQLFGVAGQVLYPSRARSLPNEPSRVIRSRIASRRLTGIFAGTVAGRGYVNALAALARQLARVDGKLVIYGPLGRAEAASLGLDLPNVEFPGLVSAKVLRERCQKEADFLYVPMSFGETDSVNMRLSFPSKLADYTEMGLPLLIHGPKYCSAVQWARKHPGVAEVVDSENEEELRQALRRLSDTRARYTLADAALRIGDLYFCHSRAESMLFSTLVGPPG
jgi:glycosyltransferase involved in cell wall biosynthesis